MDIYGNLIESFKLICAVGGGLTIIDFLHYIFYRRKVDFWGGLWKGGLNNNESLYYIKWSIIGAIGLVNGIVRFISPHFLKLASLDDPNIIHGVIIWGGLALGLSIHWINKSKSPWNIFLGFVGLFIFSFYLSGVR